MMTWRHSWYDLTCQRLGITWQYLLLICFSTHAKFSILSQEPNCLKFSGGTPAVFNPRTRPSAPSFAWEKGTRCAVALGRLAWVAVLGPGQSHEVSPFGFLGFWIAASMQKCQKKHQSLEIQTPLVWQFTSILSIFQAPTAFEKTNVDRIYWNYYSYSTVQWFKTWHLGTLDHVVKSRWQRWQEVSWRSWSWAIAEIVRFELQHLKHAIKIRKIFILILGFKLAHLCRAYRCTTCSGKIGS